MSCFMRLPLATLATLFAVMLSGVSAHAVMASPPGFPGLKVQSSPLGQNFAFPCQFGPSAQYDFSNATQVPAGGKTLLSFTGSAVHGGGSCQVAIAKKPSSDPHDWKVIHTMIGGCPATVTQTTGNLDTIGTFNGYPQGKQCAQPDSDETDCVKQYQITLPKEIASGKYFFSWSWFNKVGNREMYQNCAPIEVTGGASGDDFYNGLPPLFLANVDGKPCTTSDNGIEKNVLDIPNPGNSVQRSTNPKDATAPEVLGSCAAVYEAAAAQAAPNVPLSSGSPANLVQVPSAAPSQHAAPSIISVVPSAPAAPSQAPPAAPNQAPPAAPTAPAAPSQAPPAASPASPPTNVSTTACPSGQQKCSPDGALICISSTQFAICDHGCALPQAVAAGTTCEGTPGSAGIIAKRDVRQHVRQHVHLARHWVG